MTVFANSIEYKKKDIFSLLKLYGNFPLAYHTLQPDLEYYHTEYGYIAYKRVGRDIIVLGDPVVSNLNKIKLLDAFLSGNRNVSFIQITLQTAFILHSFGFSTTSFGCQSRLYLPYSLQGRFKKDVRLLYNAARKNSIMVKEVFDRSCIFDNSTPFIAGKNNHRSFFNGREFSLWNLTDRATGKFG